MARINSTNAEKEMGFLDHLEELRWRIIKILIALVLGTVGAFLFSDQAIPGWASTVVPIYLIGGIQLLSLGVIGEYLGKIYTETKGRPRYFVEINTRVRSEGDN